MSSSKAKQWFKRNSTVLIHMSCSILGMICGFIVRYTIPISPMAMTYIKLPGQLLVRYCSMFIVPLIIVSLASSLGTISRKGNSRLVTATFTLVVCLTTFLSVFGIILMVLIEPGAGGNFVNDFNDKPMTEEKVRSQEDAPYDILLNLVPDNIISATFMMRYTAKVPIDPKNLTLGYKKVQEQTFKTNILGLCIFSLIIGFALFDLGEKVQNIKRLLEELNVIIMRILQSFMKVFPIGMFFWMFEVGITMRSPEAVLYQLAWFTFTSLTSFVVVWLIVYPSVYFLMTRKNCYRLYANIMPAIMVAFGSGSSSITLPVTMKTMEENEKLPKTVSNFVLPLCMNLHMPGTSVYYPMVVIFVAQMHNITLTFTSMIPIAIYVIMIVMALPAAGGGGLVFFVMACDMLGVANPMSVIIYCLYIDWLIERIRTATNVMGDCVIANIVRKYCDPNNIEAQVDEEVVSLSQTDVNSKL